MNGQTINIKKEKTIMECVCVCVNQHACLCADIAAKEKKRIPEIKSNKHLFTREPDYRTDRPIIE